MPFQTDRVVGPTLMVIFIIMEGFSTMILVFLNIIFLVYKDDSLTSYETKSEWRSDLPFT